MLDRIVTLDAETEAIEERPHYPPRPVGWAIHYPDGSSRYLAFGHPSDNNISEAEAKAHIAQLRASGAPMLFHNAKFDLEVMEKWLGEPIPEATAWHDTLLLAFLDNPHSDTLALKPLSEKLLKLPPTERDELREWVLTNVEGSRRKPSQWGAHISKAPGGLVGKYAVGDVVRTRQLFDLLYVRVVKAGMGAAYLRERRLIPALIKNEQQGIACDVENLEAHHAECLQDFQRADDWIRRYLNAPSLNLDENESLADALSAGGFVKKWEHTDKGARSTAKPALDRMLSDRLLYAALMYRGSMATCVRTFMGPWLELARRNNGRLYTTWNTTKQEEGGGTRTGRLSSSKPLNLQNIPNDFEEKFGSLFAEQKLYDTLDVGELPVMRNYIVADSPDHVLLGRDFSSQEPRTFAHFEGGWLMREYCSKPTMDVYRAMMARTEELSGVTMSRKQAKVVFLGILYGMGIAKLAAQLGISTGDADRIKQALLTAIPSIATLSRDVKRELQSGSFIRTWGGRAYHVEPPKTINGENRTFEYKGLNILIQGSAADETKEALLRYNEARGSSRLVLQVHDELVICAPREEAAREMATLKASMENLELDVPMLSEGEVGYRWGGMEEFVE